MAQHKVFYSVSPEAAVQHSALRADTAINERFRAFLIAFLDACARQPDQRIARQSFITYLESLGMAASVGLVGKRIKELSKLGVLQETRCHIAGKASKVVELTSLQPVFAHFADAGRTTLVPAHRPIKNQLSLEMDKLERMGSYLSLNDTVPPRIESLFCILDAGMKLSGRDSRKSIDCKYTFFDHDHISIQTSTLDRETSDIAHLSDERAMRALNGILLDQLEDQHGSLENLSIHSLGIKDEYFFFDIYELCWRMGLRPNDQNRRIARNMLGRLRDTDFLIDASNSPYFMENYSFGAETAQYRYITEFFAKKEYAVDEQGKRQVSSDRYYMVKFHTAILTNLITVGRSFISHDGLASERSGLAHRLNNWAKAVVGVRPKNTTRPFRYTLDEFRERVIPSSRIDNFERDLLNLLKRQCIELVEEGRALHREATTGWQEQGDNVAWLYGYYYQIEWDAEKIREHRRIRRRRARTQKLYPLITIWRDVDDPFVGDNSDHNQALRRQSVAMLSAESG